MDVLKLRIGTGYIGSPSILTSKANEDIVPKQTGNSKPYNFYKFEFDNDQACTVQINKQNSIYLRAGRGFAITQEDAPITSFVIKESGITYTWAGAY